MASNSGNSTPVVNYSGNSTPVMDVNPSLNTNNLSNKLTKLNNSTSRRQQYHTRGENFRFINGELTQVEKGYQPTNEVKTQNNQRVNEFASATSRKLGKSGGRRSHSRRSSRRSSRRPARRSVRRPRRRSTRR